MVYVVTLLFCESGVGGLVLVTGIRLLRIPHRVAESRAEGQTG